LNIHRQALGSQQGESKPPAKVRSRTVATEALDLLGDRKTERRKKETFASHSTQLWAVFA
jgi:hypothetical protein